MRGGDRVEEDAATGVLVWPLLEVRILTPEELQLRSKGEELVSPPALAEPLCLQH
jgi:hypothetical protein